MPQNSEDEILERRAKVSRLYLQGWFQSRIAAEVGVTQAQVSLDLTEVRKEWQASALQDFNALKAQELMRVDQLEATYWEAWHNSLKPIKKKGTKVRGELNAPELKDGKKKEPKAKNVETTELTEERLGDPRYLDGVHRCIQKRVEILGLDAPFKVAQTDTAGKNVSSRTWVIQDNTAGAHVPAPDEEY